jgi:hypothetical protein
MTPTYASLAEKPFTTYYVWREIDIAASAAVVFARARRIGEWIDTHQMITVDGEPGEAGHFQRVLPRNLPPETPEPLHHVYGIGYLIPNRLICLEIFNENGGSRGDPRNWTVLNRIIVTEITPDETRVAFLLTPLDEAAVSPEEQESRASRWEALGDSLLTTYLQTLKRQSESDHLEEFV